MEFIDIIAGIFGSAAGGGIVGIFGSALGGIFKFFQQRQQNKFEEKKWGHEKDLITLSNERAKEEDEHEVRLVSQEGSWAGLNNSINADAVPTDTYRWSKTIKELFRPLLTTGLFILVYLVFRDLMSMFSGGNSALAVVFTAVEAKGIMAYLINSIVFTAVTSGVWWYGDRAFAPPGMKNR